MKFFYIHAEVIPMVMQFRDSAPIAKEDLKIPRGAAWYEKLLALPNQAFSEQVLVTVGMSDRWPHGILNVPVLLLDGEEVVLYHRTFPAHAGVMGVRPLRAGEEYWSEQIRPNFLYARADVFAVPPVATEGAHIPNPRPCRATAHAGKEIVYLSSEESIASSENELNLPHDVFSGVLHNLGIDHEEKKRKRVRKKKVTVAEGVAIKNPEVTGAASDATSSKGTARIRQHNLNDFVYVADSFEELYAIGGKPQVTLADGVRSSGNVGSKEQLSSATPTSTHADEAEANPSNVELIRKNVSKRSREQTKSEAAPREPRNSLY
ncbi:hypothetical protein Hdeb2414_s0020g00553451 [Helianthus debilis subsp. tardiflorus]